MKRIKLTQGKYAIVDDEDYPYLRKFNWIAECSNGSNIKEYYAARRITTCMGRGYLIGIEYFIMPSARNGGSKIVHKNYNSLDCRKENIEYRQNGVAVHNKRKTKIPKTSKYKGVHWNKINSNWVAKIGIDYKSLWLGVFQKEKNAAKAYNKKAKELYGEFAYQNKIQ